jgi:hypothetical protein
MRHRGGAWTPHARSRRSGPPLNRLLLLPCIKSQPRCVQCPPLTWRPPGCRCRAPPTPASYSAPCRLPPALALRHRGRSWDGNIWEPSKPGMPASATGLAHAAPRGLTALAAGLAAQHSEQTRLRAGHCCCAWRGAAAGSPLSCWVLFATWTTRHPASQAEHGSVERESHLAMLAPHPGGGVGRACGCAAPGHGGAYEKPHKGARSGARRA